MILNLAGCDLNDHFEPLPQPKKIVQDIKEKLSCVVLDYELEMASAALLSHSIEMYALSDSQFITIDNIFP